MVSEDRKKAAERRKAGTSGTGRPASNEIIEVGIEISWLSEEANKTRSKVSFRTIVQMTFSEAVSHLRLKPGEAKNRVTLLKMFSDSVAARFRETIERQGYSKVRVHGKVAEASFDELMAALETRGLVTKAEAPLYVKQRAKYWQLSASGAERMNRD